MLTQTGKAGPQAVFRYVESRATRRRVSRSRSFQDRAGCYHFATQLDGTGQNKTVWPPAYGCNLGPKTLTKQHAME